MKEKSNINSDETISKKQLRELCRIGQRTADYLLMSGLIPSMNTGKKTRNIMIKKSDALKYLEKRKASPIDYLPPPNWYADNAKAKKCKRKVTPKPTVSKCSMKAYYSSLLSGEREILSVRDICRITGYCRSTINNWLGSKNSNALLF